MKVDSRPWWAPWVGYVHPAVCELKPLRHAAWPITGPWGATPFDRKAQPLTKPRPPLSRSLWKTEMCESVASGRQCAFGLACLYAHCKEELRPRQRQAGYRTEPCKLEQDGFCPYGKRCNFKHNLYVMSQNH